jgi:hypothetical protein
MFRVVFEAKNKASEKNRQARPCQGKEESDIDCVVQSNTEQHEAKRSRRTRCIAPGETEEPEDLWGEKNMAKQESYLMDLSESACDVVVRQFPSENYQFIVKTRTHVLWAHVEAALADGDILPEHAEAFRLTWHFGLVAVVEGGIVEGCFEPAEAWRLETVVKGFSAYRRNPNRLALVAAHAALDRIAHAAVGKMEGRDGSIDRHAYGAIRMYADVPAHYLRSTGT